MSLVSDIYNIVDPNNPAAQAATANAQANLAAIQLAEQQATQSATIPTWAIIMIIVSVLAIGGLVWWKLKNK